MADTRDALGGLLLTDDAPWCACRAAIDLRWDQWAVCGIWCVHGTFEASSRLLNLSEALDNALALYRAAAHPAHCNTEFDAVYDGEAYRDDCERWVGHDGPHGHLDDEPAAEEILARSRAALAAFDGRGVNNFDIPTPAEVLNAWRDSLGAELVTGETNA